MIALSMKPRIVLLSAFLTPYRSGAEACAEEIAHRLHREFDITIVTARLKKKSPEDDPFHNQARVVRVGIGSPIDKWFFPFLAPLVVRRLQPQIVHAVLESFAGLAMVFSKVIFARAKYILTCQSTNTSFLIGPMHRRADRVTVISRALVARAQHLGRTDALLIPNGIDVPAIERACADFKKIPGRILFVGRLEPMKGVDVLLRAFSRIALTPLPPSPSSSPVRSESVNVHLGGVVGRGGSQDHWHLRIVGSGSQEKELKRLAEDLKISDRVTFVGFVPMPRVFEEFAQAQIFCGLSRSEALGNVFLEAQAAGCAVVAARVGGIPDIVEDGRTGILVPSDDAEAAANALLKLLTDTRQWQELAAAGIAHARSYDWSGITERYGEVYRSMRDKPAGFLS